MIFSFRSIIIFQIIARNKRNCNKFASSLQFNSNTHLKLKLEGGKRRERSAIWKISGLRNVFEKFHLRDGLVLKLNSNLYSRKKAAPSNFSVVVWIGPLLIKIMQLYFHAVFTCRRTKLSKSEQLPYIKKKVFLNGWFSRTSVEYDLYRRFVSFHICLEQARTRKTWRA